MTPLFESIANCLQNNIDAGNIRNLNSTVMTLAIAFTVFAQADLSKLVDGGHLCKMDDRELLETYTHFWLSALTPGEQKLIA